jgi:hypothetical protein
LGVELRSASISEVLISFCKRTGDTGVVLFPDTPPMSDDVSLEPLAD